MTFERQRLQHLATLNNEVLPESFDQDQWIWYAEVSDVSQGQEVQWKDPIQFSNAPSRARRVTRDGDTVISTVRTYLKAITYISNPPEPAIVSTGFAVVRPRSIHPKYLAYATQSQEFVDQIVSKSVGVSYPAISPAEVAHSRIPVAPLRLQARIAEYLDHETAEIDAFIFDQKLFLKLFLERAHSQAFAILSNGANSGVDYSTCASKRIFYSLDHRRIPLSASERAAIQGNIPYYGASGVIDHVNNHIFDEDLIAVAEDGANLITRNNPICFAIQGKSWVNNHAHVLKPPSGHLRLWVNLIEIQDIAPYVTGAAQPKLTIEALMNLQLNVPAPQLWGTLDSKLVACENETAAVKKDVVRSIDLARERRAALITATVTGQIDVTARNKPAAEQLEDDIAQGLHREN